MNNKIPSRQQRLFDLIEPFKNSKNIAFSRLSNKKTEFISYEKYYELSHLLAEKFISSGICIGDAVGSILNNRKEWNIIDMGVVLSGAVHVSIFPTFSEENIIHILSQSKVKVLFVSKPSIYSKILSLKDKLPNLQDIILVNNNQFYDYIPDKTSTILKDKLEGRKKNITNESICSILYTSGSSSKPKGVPISHTSFLIYAESLNNTYGDFAGSNMLSFLPLCHGFERSHSYYYQAHGKQVNYIDPGPNLLQYIEQIKPTFFTIVPSILSTLLRNIEVDKKEINKVFPKLQIISSSGAQLNESIIKFFKEKTDILLLQSYGCTECLGISANNIHHNKPSTSGKILPYVEIKINNEGEVMVKSPTLFKNYFKIKTSAFFEGDYFKTGDLGELDNEGYLTLKGRKNNYFKLPNGRFFDPFALEEKIKDLKSVNECILTLQDNRLIAIINLHLEKSNELKTSEIKNHILALNRKHIDNEKISGYIITENKWSPDSGEYTHNMKQRRSFIRDKYINLEIEFL
ncbi:MAG: AMP-binding protein [Chitinophagales bacterium]